MAQIKLLSFTVITKIHFCCYGFGSRGCQHYACSPTSTFTTVENALLTLVESSDMYYHDFANSSSAALRTLVQYVKHGMLLG